MIPDPVVEKVEGIYVVRDDLILGGTKRCFTDALVLGHEEVVYASPAYGGAQIAIAHAAKEAGSMATIFCAKRKYPHSRTLEAKEAGAKVVQIPYGYLSVIKKKAKDYCRKTGAFLLPFGLESEIALESIAKRAVKAQSQIPGNIDEAWCVGGSGVLARGLQRGLTASSYHVVQIGRSLTPSDVGNATVYIHPLEFAEDAIIKPPFPSCSNYDAKVWEFIKKDSKDVILFWNVMR